MSGQLDGVSHQNGVVLIDDGRDNLQPLRSQIVTLLLVGCSGSGLTLGDQHAGHLVTLRLAAKMGAESSLEELQRTLVLRHAQQFHATLLVRGEAGHFSHNVTDELVVLGVFALGLGGSRLALVLDHLMTLVEAADQFVVKFAHFDELN